MYCHHKAHFSCMLGTQTVSKAYHGLFVASEPCDWGKYAYEVT